MGGGVWEGGNLATKVNKFSPKANESEGMGIEDNNSLGAPFLANNKAVPSGGRDAMLSPPTH